MLTMFTFAASGRGSWKTAGSSSVFSLGCFRLSPPPLAREPARLQWVLASSGPLLGYWGPRSSSSHRKKNNSSLFTSPWHFCFVCLCSYNRRRWTMPSSSSHVSLLNKGAFGWEFATFKLLCEIFSSVQSQIMDEYEDCSFGSECFGLLYSGLGFLLRGRRGSHGLTSETASAICIIILLF